MRKLFIFAFLALFLANTSIVSALAQQPCTHDMNTPSSMSEMASTDGTPPCHQTEEKQQSDNKLCEGLCLCAHVSSSPSLFMKSKEGMCLPFMIKQSFSIDNDALVSVSQIPPKRPPKYIS